MKRLTRLLAVATALLVVSSGLAAGPAQAAGPDKSVLFNVVGWDGDSGTPADPLGLPSTSIRNYWNNTVSSWFREVSRTAVGGLVVQFPLESTIPTPHSDNPDINSPTCDHQFLDRLADSADAAARVRGVNPASFDVVVYYFDDFGCVGEDGDDFHSAQRGNHLFFQGGTLGVAPMRELGHWLGLSSAEALHCRDLAGNPVRLSNTCVRDPQGDVWDSMGSGIGVYSVGNLNALGWIPHRTETIRPCDCVLHRTLDALAGEDGTRLGIELQDGTDVLGRPVNYWLEYRKPIRRDQPGANGIEGAPEPQQGLIVHREVPNAIPGLPPVQQLLDMTPGDDFQHAALPFDQPWDNALGTMRVKIDVFHPDDTVNITISHQGVQVPDVRYANLADATQALQDAGLDYRLAFPTVDPFCNNLDDVVTEIPAPGHFVPAGNSVTISLGMRDPDHGCPDRPVYLAVNVGWNASGNTQESPLEPSKPMFTFLHGTMDAWFNQASLGRSPGFAFVDGGSYMIDTPHMDGPDQCGSDFSDDVLRRARLAAEAHGFIFPSFPHYVVHWGSEVCEDYAGKTVPSASNSVLLQGEGSLGGTAMHEFGHVLGLQHSDSVHCTGPGGIKVPLSNTCTPEKQGDVFSVMGHYPLEDNGVANLFTASHLAQLGWLDNRYVTVQAPIADDHETIEPLADTSTGVHAVKLVDGPTTLWIEYRQPIGLDAQGFDTGFQPGLIIHRQLTNGGDASAQLLDMRPNAAGFDLRPGETWANPLGTAKITVDSADPAGAHITIGSQLLTVPDVQGMSLQDARSAIEGAGFTWGGTSQTLTSNCELIGAIIGQDPTGGTHQPAGSLVTPSLGVLDPRFQCK